MDSVREIHMIATATFSLLSVVTWSIIRFTVWGPTISVWTYRTQLSHDLLQFMATCSAFPILHQVNQACLEYWPRLAQYINPSREPLTQFQIPQYQLTEADLLVPNNKSLSDLDVLSDPFVAPIHADFTGLPPTLVQMGGAEVMGDDIQEFTKRARMQGAHIELQVYDNMFHVFQASLPKTQHLDEAWDN
ncbi:hypothetical protein GGH16_004136, partial [Coemansia sp. RSA 560]